MGETTSQLAANQPQGPALASGAGVGEPAPGTPWDAGTVQRRTCPDCPLQPEQQPGGPRAGVGGRPAVLISRLCAAATDDVVKVEVWDVVDKGESSPRREGCASLGLVISVPPWAEPGGPGGALCSARHHSWPCVCARPRAAWPSSRGPRCPLCPGLAPAPACPGQVPGLRSFAGVGGVGGQHVVSSVVGMAWPRGLEPAPCFHPVRRARLSRSPDLGRRELPVAWRGGGMVGEAGQGSL